MTVYIHYPTELDSIKELIEGKPEVNYNDHLPDFQDCIFCNIPHLLDRLDVEKKD